MNCGGWGYNSVVEYLPSMQKALGPIRSIIHAHTLYQSIHLSELYHGFKTNFSSSWREKHIGIPVCWYICMYVLTYSFIRFSFDLRPTVNKQGFRV